MITMYIPSNDEADRFLENVQKWVKTLKASNVSADIAAYIARDFLAPMRIRPLEGDNPQNGMDAPIQEAAQTMIQPIYTGCLNEQNGHED